MNKKVIQLMINDLMKQRERINILIRGLKGLLAKKGV